MLADLVVVAHFAFIVFAVAGGILVVKWPRLVWVHLAAVGWAAVVELCGWICPLTPLENRLRGEPGYRSDFISHYLVPVMYPAGLTRKIQIALGVSVIVLNVVIYSWILSRRKKKNGR